MPQSFAHIKACVFDAYGTLFDVHSAVGAHRGRLGESADAVSALWRTKQLEYTWLRSLMGTYTSFWQITGDALDYALETHAIDSAELREDLMQAYLHLSAYAEIPGVLGQLKAAGLPCAILTNGSPDMIKAAVDSAGLQSLIDKNLSVEQAGIFKPDPSVYQLAVDALGIAPEAICFQSSNAWDAAGAAQFGFTVVWVNRFGQRPERLPARPHHEMADLAAFPELLGL